MVLTSEFKVLCEPYEFLAILLQSNARNANWVKLPWGYEPGIPIILAIEVGRYTQMSATFDNTKETRTSFGVRNTSYYL